MWYRVGISLFLVYHLLVVLVLPNPDSLVYRQLSPVLSPYGNFFGINNTWRFFSPNPTLRTLEYEARTYDASGEVVREEVRLFPASKEDVGSRESYNRRLNFAMMTSSRENMINEILKPWLCQIEPWAEEISVFLLQRVFPTYDKAKLLDLKMASMATTQRIPVKEFQCKGELE